MSLENASFIAKGNINPSRVVKVDAANDFAVLEASAGADQPIGIAQAGTKNAPGAAGASALAAETGNSIRVHGPGEVCLAHAGAAITRGAALESDASGRVITVVTGKRVGFALQSAAAAGELIRILVAL